jgi:hypothetical protein
MEKIVQVSVGKMAVVSLVIAMALALAGCALVGQVTQVDNQILFGNQDKKQGIFTQGGLTVDYSYRLSGGNINLEGQVSFSGRADSLNVYLLFVDGAGTVLVQKIIYSSGYRDSSRQMSDRTFQHTFIVPTKAKGVSFSYTAQPYRGQR